MGRQLDTFLKGATPQSRLAALALAVSAAGVGLAFSIDYGSSPLTFVAAGLVMLGIGIGWVGIIWGWREMFRDLRRGSVWAPDDRAMNLCAECGSSYVAVRSKMAALCPECAHHLYGYPLCNHRMVGGRCTICGWDGSRSPYVSGLIAKRRTSTGER